MPLTGSADLRIRRNLSPATCIHKDVDVEAMQGLRQKQRVVMAAAMALVLLAPVFYLATHTCLHPQGLWMASPAGNGNQRNFCNGCVFEWLSLFMLPALAATALFGRARFVPSLRPLVLFVRPAASPTSRAPPRPR